MLAPSGEAGGTQTRKSTGRVCFAWYRLNVTIPDRVGDFDPTGATVVFELTAPFLLWLPGTRWLVAVQSVLFHGGIGVLMGLVIFALEATMVQFVVFPDSSYRRLVARLRRRSTSVAVPASEAAPG